MHQCDVRLTRFMACREGTAHRIVSHRENANNTGSSTNDTCILAFLSAMLWMYMLCARVGQELSLNKLREMQGRTHEDPLREVATLQYFAGEEHPNVLTYTEVRRTIKAFWALYRHHHTNCHASARLACLLADVSCCCC